MKKIFTFLMTMMLATVSIMAKTGLKPAGSSDAGNVAVPAFSEFVADGETIFYLYNVEAHAFVTGGNDWGTRASGNIEKGNQFKFTDNGGKYKMADLVNGNWNALDCDGNKDSWVDGQGRTGDGEWVIAPLGNNTYSISNARAGELKWGIQLDMANSRVQFKSNAAYGYTWAFVSVEDYDAYMAELDKEAVNALLAENTAVVNEALADEIKAANKVALDAMGELVNGTNIYGEGFEAYAAKYNDYLAKYEAGTLTETVVNPSAATGWHSSTEFNFLLTPWISGDKACNNFDNNQLYINTWSTEGIGDGTNFLVPFFEYFANDDNGKLGANTIKTTITGLVPGKEYTASVLTRVRVKKDDSEVEAYGITFQVGDGEAANICDGDVFERMRIKEVSATGVADANGELVIAFNVAADNNVHWLSFKNVSYGPSEFTPIPAEIADGAYRIVNVESGAFLSNGAFWGTRAVLADNGISYNVVRNLENGKYTLKSGIKGDAKALRPSDGFNDQSGEWEIFQYDKNGGVVLFNGEKYFSYDGTNIPQFVDEPTDASVWQFVSEDAIKAMVATATRENPMDATIYVKGADFLNGDVANAAWAGNKVGGNVGSGNTLINNTNCEAWNKGAFTISQTITDLPNGFYDLTAFGFYREGNRDVASSVDAYENGTENASILSANDKSVALKSVYSEAKTEAEGGWAVESAASSAGNVYFIPNSQGEAAACFEAGAYLNEIKNIEVTDGTLTISVSREGEAIFDWTVFDNIRLTYYGTEAPAEQTIDAYLIDGEDQIALNSHSSVSAEKTEGIEVRFGIPTAVETASYYITPLVPVETEEGTSWVLGANTKTGEFSINTVAYAEVKYTFEQGTKYQIDIKATYKDGTDETASFQVNGAAEVAPATLEGEPSVNGTELTVVFPVGTDLGDNYAVKPYIKSGNDVIEIAEYSIDNTTGGFFDPLNKLIITLKEELAAGEYTLVIPAGTFIVNGGDNNSELTIPFTVEATNPAIIGETLKLMPGGNSNLPIPDDAVRVFSFTNQWSSTAPAVNSFDASIYKEIVIEFKEALPFYYNTPHRLAGVEGDAGQKWGGVAAGETEYRLDLTETGSITDFSIQNTQASETPGNTFAIAKAYAVKLDGSVEPLFFQAPGWGGSMAVEADIYSANVTFNGQWANIGIDGLKGVEGKKIIRVYTNTPINPEDVQFCIKTTDGADAWPQIILQDETKCYGLAEINETLETILLQWKSATPGSMDIVAVTVEVEQEQTIETVLLYGEEQIAINTHSSVSAEQIDGINVQFGIPAAVKSATYSIMPMTLVQNEEGSSWTPNTENATTGDFSINTIANAEVEYIFEQGTKYQIVVKVNFFDGTDATETYEIDGAYVDAEDPEIAIADMKFNVAEDAELDEDGTFKVEFTYSATMNDAASATFPSGMVAYKVTDAEDNVVAETETDFDLSLTSRNIYLKNLEPGKTYTLTATKIYGAGLDMTTFETVEIPATITGELPTVTFTVPEEMAIETSLIYGEEETTLNSHSNVNVDQIQAIKVNFIGMPNVISATYSIAPMTKAESAEGTSFTPNTDEATTGELSINTIGYAAVDYKFEQGTKYQIVVKATLQDGTVVSETYEINGSTATYNGYIASTGMLLSTGVSKSFEQPETISVNTKEISFENVLIPVVNIATGDFTIPVTTETDATGNTIYRAQEVDVDLHDVYYSGGPNDAVPFKAWLIGMESTDGPIIFVHLQSNLQDIFIAYNALLKDAKWMMSEISPEDVNAGGAKVLNFLEATSINSVATDAKANGKYLENGKVIIVNKDKKYNVNGAIIK